MSGCIGRAVSLSLALALLVLAACVACAEPMAPVIGLPDFTELVERHGPAVVNISSKQGPESAPFGLDDRTPLPDDSPLYDFFRRFFGDEGELHEFGEIDRSLGSGFFVSSDGYVVTNAHVVEGAEEIIVRTSDRREFFAELIGVDRRSDIALLKVDGQDLPQVQIGSAAGLRVGEWVLAIGSPFGFDHSATVGIVSAKGRNLPSDDYVPFIQTDVAINPGNSGGPLFDLRGRVVGVNSQIYSRTGGFMGLSFAIPIEVAMDVVEQLRSQGRVVRGWLGVLIQDVTRELADSFGLSQARGALVAQVLPDSPALAAGLRAGDIILRFNDKEIFVSANLPPLVGATKVGERARIEILRTGHPIDIELVIGELDDESDALEHAAEEDAPVFDRIGLRVRDPLPEEQRRLGVEGGVLVETVGDGPAARAGLRGGDLILQFAERAVRDSGHWHALLATAHVGQAIAVLVQRGDGQLFYALRIPAEPAS